MFNKYQLSLFLTDGKIEACVDQVTCTAHPDIQQNSTLCPDSQIISLFTLLQLPPHPIPEKAAKILSLAGMDCFYSPFGPTLFLVLQLV